MWAYRLRFALPEDCRFRFDEKRYTLWTTGPQAIDLVACAGAGAIADAAQLALESWPFESEEEARRAAAVHRDALCLALLSSRTGAYFGDGTPTGGLTAAGREALEQHTGVPVHNDRLGLLVYERHATNAPLFLRISAKGTVLRPADRFLAAFQTACSSGVGFSPREQLAFEAYSHSHFADLPAKFLFLVTAAELLADPRPRCDACHALLHELEEAVGARGDLATSTRDSLIGGIRRLGNESVRQAMRRIARERLPHRSYEWFVQSRQQEGTAEQLFSYCYDLRNRLVHGLEPAPNPHEVATAANQMSSLVADLLSAGRPGVRE